MPEDRDLLIHLPDQAATEDVAARVAPLLRRGDCILLEGSVGAGKSTFARSLIRSLLTVAEDIPSPTFTLIQTYETPDFDIWHCDLYRLSNTQELVELGLEDAFSDAVSLIEWPDRLGDLTPPDAQLFQLTISQFDDDGRDLTIRGDDRWAGLDKEPS